MREVVRGFRVLDLEEWVCVKEGVVVLGGSQSQRCKMVGWGKFQMFAPMCNVS
jgi:hypothetical protein